MTRLSHSALADLPGAGAPQAFGDWRQAPYAALYPNRPGQTSRVDRIVALRQS